MHDASFIEELFQYFPKEHLDAQIETESLGDLCVKNVATVVCIISRQHLTDQISEHLAQFVHYIENHRFLEKIHDQQGGPSP